MSKNFAFFLEHAVQCILENSAANDKLLSSFLFLKKLKVFHLLKYSVEPDKLKDKTYEKFIQIIMDCWKLKLFLRTEGFHFLPLGLEGVEVLSTASLEALGDCLVCSLKGESI